MRRLLSLAVAFAVVSVPAYAAEFRAGTYIAEGANLVGLCMMMDGVVNAAYRQGDNVGVTMYHINDDGSLEGAWTVAGQNGSGTEKLTPQ